jgi:predicted ATPase
MLGDGASEIARLLPELRRRYSDIPEPMELPPELQRRSLINSLLDFLGRAARAKPIVVLLDDLHWAQESSLLLLEHLVPDLPGLPVLLLATYRDVELEVGKPFEKTLARLVRQKLARRLAVKRLSQAEAARLVAALAGADPPPALAAAIYGETEGNPFFVTEVFQHLSEEGRLFDAEGRLRFSSSADSPSGGWAAGPSSPSTGLRRSRSTRRPTARTSASRRSGATSRTICPSRVSRRLPLRSPSAP